MDSDSELENETDSEDKKIEIDIGKIIRTSMICAEIAKKKILHPESLEYALRVIYPEDHVFLIEVCSDKLKSFTDDKAQPANFKNVGGFMRRYIGNHQKDLPGIKISRNAIAFLCGIMP